MDKKAIALGAALLIAAGAANAELKAFKVNGETVSVAEQKAVYDRAVAQGQPAGPELESQVKNLLIQQNADVQRAIDNARNQILIQGLAQDWAKKNPVSDADLQKAYEADKASYGDTEYQVRHILVKTEDQAKNLISRLAKGADFGKLAQEFSEDTANKAQGGLLGWVVPRSFVLAFGAAFSALKPGEVAQAPVRTQFGFHVVKLEAKRKAELYPSFDSQKAVIHNALANQKVQQHFQELIKRAVVK